MADSAKDIQAALESAKISARLTSAEVKDLSNTMADIVKKMMSSRKESEKIASSYKDIKSYMTDINNQLKDKLLKEKLMGGYYSGFSHSLREMDTFERSIEQTEIDRFKLLEHAKEISEQNIENISRLKDEMVKLNIQGLTAQTNDANLFKKLSTEKGLITKQLNKLKSQPEPLLPGDKRKREDLIKELESRKNILQNYTDEYKLSLKIGVENKAQMLNIVKTAYNAKLMSTLAREGGKIWGETGKAVLTMSNNIVFAYKTLGAVAGVYQTIIELLKLSVERYVQLEKASEEFRKTTGFTLSQTKELRSYAEKLNVEFVDYGVHLKDALEAAKALVLSLGNVQVYNNVKDLNKTVALLHVNLGVSEANAAGFLTQMMKVGRVGSSTATSYASYASSLAKAAGVPLDIMMKDISEASGETLSMLRGSSSELIKAAAHARTFGVSLEAISKATRSMLNFQESVGDEMEAAVLIGKNLTFQRAREKAFLGDIKGSQDEILRTIKGVGDFTKLNVFQQEALAKASGMEIKDINQMLMLDKQRSQLSGKDRIRYEELLKMKDSSIQKTGKEALMQMEMQSHLTKISNSFSKIIISLSNMLLPAVEIIALGIEKIASFAAFIIPPLTKVNMLLIKTIGYAASISEYIGLTGWIKNLSLVTSLTAKWTSAVAFISPYFIKIGGFFASILGKITSIFPFLLKIGSVAGFIGKWLTPIGWIITAVQAVYNIWKRFTDPDMGQGFLAGLKAIGMGLVDTLLGPFIDVWNWIKDRFMGNSPSQLGLGILDGIKSIAGMLFDVLTAPFRSAFNFVSGLFGGVQLPKLSTTLGLSDSGKTNSPSDTVKDSQNTMSGVESKIQELIDLMKAGAIKVDIDGRNASRLIAFAS